ncbi:hypothetical protein ACH5RR_014669 [Cinchona calisaya]|uniref:Uncharacterized protein n=1 Tax=Cinchona calisaya TaxID=153742 RepID=A0ABD2ZUH6_9GENT
MATKSDQAALHSSITLLQERFKQLQKIREMRQERELLRLLSDIQERRTSSYSSSSIVHSYQPSASLFCNSQVNIHQKPSSQLALSLWPDSHMKHDNFGGLEYSAAQDNKSSGLCGTALGNASSVLNKFDDSSSSDVDTSLHL